MLSFMFATGIENSYPTIKNGRARVDELEKCGHYKHWRKDFELVKEQGIRFLRYGPPIHTTWLGHGRYDWGFLDETLEVLKTRDIVPIVDLCHFGVPDWIGNFQNPDFPDVVRASTPRLCAAVSMDATVYAGERDVHLCDLFGALRLVE